MMPERMSKVLVAAPKTFMENTIRDLHAMKAVHILEHKRDEIDTGTSLAAAEKLSELLLIARSLGAHLNINFTASSKQPQTLPEAEKLLIQLQKEVTQRIEKIKQADEQLKSLNQTENELKTVSGLGLDLDLLSGYKNITAIIGTIKNPDTIKKELSTITDRFDIYQNENTIAIFIETEKRQEAMETLGKTGFSEINISNIIGLKGTVNSNLNRVKQEKEKLRTETSMLNSDLAKISERSKKNLISAENLLSEELEKAEAPLKFAATNNIFLITGWIPSTSFYALKNRLEKATSGKLFIKEEEFGHDEKVPVKLKNPSFAKPFEFLTNLRGLPLYNEVDPTFWMFLSFPIFFGFMLGDIGYGIFTLALALFLRSKLEKGKGLMTMIAISAVSSIIFGFVFGEFFGEETLMGMEIPHLINRVHDMQNLLLLSIAFGVVHVNIGLATGFYNELRNHGFKEAILEKFSWLLIQLGAPFILSLLKIVKIPENIQQLSMISLAVGIIMLAIGELKIGAPGAFKAIVESVTIFSNILSYARLMAVGLASVQLALIVNEFAKEAFHQGGFSIVIGLAILIIGHAINLVLGLLGSFLHSLRLEYVEFFTKFFKGGAEPYKPFGEAR